MVDRPLGVAPSLLSDAHVALVPDTVNVYTSFKYAPPSQPPKRTAVPSASAVMVWSKRPLGVAPSLISDVQFTDVPEVHNHNAKYNERRTKIMVASSTSVSESEENAA